MIFANWGGVKQLNFMHRKADKRRQKLDMNWKVSRYFVRKPQIAFFEC